MTLKFNLMATIEIPNADKFPPKERAEKDLREFFECEGMIVRSLAVTDYRAEEPKDD